MEMEEEKRGRGRDSKGRFAPKSGEADGENGSDGSEWSPENGIKHSRSETEDLSGTTAPSIGPNTTIERRPPEERLAEHEQSDVDAMGLDKRREVVGHSYGPSVAKQASLYGIFLAIAAAVVIGFILLAGKLDAPPDHVEAKAPWTGTQQQAEGAGLSSEPNSVN